MVDAHVPAAGITAKHPEKKMIFIAMRAARLFWSNAVSSIVAQVVHSIPKVLRDNAQMRDRRYDQIVRLARPLRQLARLRIADCATCVPD
jgi:hypothetical protein